MKKKNDFLSIMSSAIPVRLNAMSRANKRRKVVKGAVIGGLVGFAVGAPIVGAVAGGVYENEKNKRR